MAEFIGTLGVSNAAATVPNQSLRQYYTPTDAAVFKEWLRAPFLYNLHKDLRRTVVTDPKPKPLEYGDPTSKGTLYGDNGQGTAAALLITTNYVKIANAETYIQPGDILHVAFGATNQTNTSSGSLFGENLVVEEIVRTGTSAVVRVSRASGAGGANAGGVTAGSGNGLAFKIISHAVQEASGGREPHNVALSEEQNFTQIIRAPWRISFSKMGTKTFGGSDWERQGSLARRSVMRQQEGMLLFGQRASRFSGEDEQRFAGGMLWWLMNGTSGYTSWSASADLVNGTADYDSLSRLWKITDKTDPTLWSVNKWVKAIERICYKGNPNKTCYCGSGFATELQLLFQSMIKLDNDPQMFGIQVMRLVFPTGELKFYVDREFDDAGYSYHACIVDEEYLKIGTLKGNELRVRENIQSKKDHFKENELTCEKTLLWNFWQAHSWIWIVA